MRYLRTKSFFKYYNAILNNTLVKEKMDNLKFANATHIFDVTEKEKNLTPSDVLVGVVQTNPPKTDSECTFPLFKFYGQPCATIFYRANSDSDDFMENLYICKNEYMDDVKSYILNNPFGLNLNGYDYPRFLNDVVAKYESPTNTPSEKQLLNVIKQTSMFLSAVAACKQTTDKICNLQQTKFLNGKINIQQKFEKKEHEIFVRKVYLDTKTLSPQKFIEKYDTSQKTTKFDEKIK